MAASGADGGKGNDESVTRTVPNSPFISIIIVVFRECEELTQLLNNVLSMKSPHAEVVVIDGGSDDGSVDVLRQYAQQIDYWVSEPDHGLYDAMNKGIAAARGQFIYHINAGDRLLHLPVSELLEADADEVDIASFAVLIDGKARFCPSAGWRLKFNNTLHHQGTFYRRLGFPGYDVRYKVFADFNANQRLMRQGAYVRTWNKIVALHTSGGVSHQRASTWELYRIVASNYGRAYVPLTWLDGKWNGFRRRIAKMNNHS